MTRHNTPRVCFIGFGEAGQAFASGFREGGIERIAAWDILFPESEGRPLREAGERLGVRLGTSAADALEGAEVVLSAVTAASSLEAARSAKAHLSGQFYFDLNSVSPGRKRESAQLLGAAARYVDVAVMAPVHPARNQTPLLLAGPHVEGAEQLAAALGMRASKAGAEIGAAAAIKMVRSVMIKGLEALTQECFLAAARAGIVSEVMASLSKSLPGLDWPRTIEYNLERMAVHGIRRAAEMEEVAETLRELGIEPLMAEATVGRQRDMGRLGKLSEIREATTGSYKTLLAAISAAARA